MVCLLVSYLGNAGVIEPEDRVIPPLYLPLIFSDSDISMFLKVSNISTVDRKMEEPKLPS